MQIKDGGCVCLCHSFGICACTAQSYCTEAFSSSTEPTLIPAPQSRVRLVLRSQHHGGHAHEYMLVTFPTRCIYTQSGTLPMKSSGRLRYRLLIIALRTGSAGVGLVTTPVVFKPFFRRFANFRSFGFFIVLLTSAPGHIWPLHGGKAKRVRVSDNMFVLRNNAEATLDYCRSCSPL